VKALIFTHPPDYPAATIATEAWNRLGVDVTWAIEKRHAPPGGQKHVITEQPRRGNLNGLGFCFELLDLMRCFDFKGDSDTLVFSLDWADRPEPLVGFSVKGRQDFYGACWHMKRDAAPKFLSTLRTTPALCTSLIGEPEDRTVGSVGQIVGRHVYDYDPKGCPLAGWNWNTSLTEAEYRRRFQVVNVQMPSDTKRTHPGLREARQQVVDQMKKLLDAPPLMLDKN